MTHGGSPPFLKSSSIALSLDLPGSMPSLSHHERLFTLPPQASRSSNKELPQLRRSPMQTTTRRYTTTPALPCCRCNHRRSIHHRGLASLHPPSLSRNHHHHHYCQSSVCEHALHHTITTTTAAKKPQLAPPSTSRACTMRLTEDLWPAHAIIIASQIHALRKSQLNEVGGTNRPPTASPCSYQPTQSSPIRSPWPVLQGVED